MDSKKLDVLGLKCRDAIEARYMPGVFTSIDDAASYLCMIDDDGRRSEHISQAITYYQDAKEYLSRIATTLEFMLARCRDEMEQSEQERIF